MYTARYLLWLAEQSLLIYALPFNIALLAIIILYVRTNYPPPKRPRLLILLGSLQFLIPVIIVLLGTFFRHRADSQPSPTQWLIYTALLLCALQIPIGIYIALEVKQSRFLIASLTAVQIFVSFIAMFVASMSIGGDWI